MEMEIALFTKVVGFNPLINSLKKQNAKVYERAGTKTERF